MRVGQRLLVVMRHMFVKLGVLLRRDVGLVARPQRAGLVDGLEFVFVVGFFFLLVPFLFLHQDRQRNVVRVFADGRFQLPGRQEFVFAFAQVQRDVGAARGLVDGLDREIAGAGGLPAHAFIGSQTGAARFDSDAVGDNEARVKTDAELADQRRILLLVSGQLGEELLGVGLVVVAVVFVFFFLVLAV